MSDCILVLFPGSLGDFLCFLPALESLCHNMCSAKVALAVRGAGVEIAERLPRLSRVYRLESGIFSRLFSTTFGEQAEEQQFFSTFTHVFTWFGRDNPQVRKNLEKYTPVVHSFPFFIGQEGLHACRYYLSCVGDAEIACPSVCIPETQRLWMQQYWDRNAWSQLSRVLAIHPGSGGQKKRWAPEGFRQVAEWWKSVHNGAVVIVLGPAEEEEHGEWVKIGVVEHDLSLWQLAGVLSRSMLYLGNDSGVSHLAGAVGACGAVIFGPTRPEQWRPLGGALTPIRNQRYRKEFPHTSGITLHEVRVEDVTVTLDMSQGNLFAPGLSKKQRKRNMGTAQGTEVR